MIRNHVVPVRGLAFDMDGTLISSTPLIRAIWHDWAIRHGLDPLAVVTYSAGRTLGMTLARFCPPGLDRATQAEVLLGAANRRTAELRPVAGAGDFLAGLDDGEWALVTSANRALARRWMAACGLPWPRVAVTAEDVDRPKPDSQPYLVAAGLLGIAPAQMAVFEDAPAGIAAGRAAGCPVFIIGDEPGGIADFNGLRRDRDNTTGHFLIDASAA